VDVLRTLVEGNRRFAEDGFVPGLTMGPSLNTVVICCLDARVDPAVVLGVEPGQLAVIRNVGGRVTPRTVLELGVLQEVARAAGPGRDRAAGRGVGRRAEGGGRARHRRTAPGLVETVVTP
jgi:hypothetical protein